jgi:hypothetical protein
MSLIRLAGGQSPLGLKLRVMSFEQGEGRGICRNSR